MSFRSVMCVVLGCDGCGEHSDLHFAGYVAAMTWARENGWTVTEGRAWCPACERRAACALVGHRPGEWTQHADGGLVYRSRVCAACGESEHELVAGGAR